MNTKRWLSGLCLLAALVLGICLTGSPAQALTTAEKAEKTYASYVSKHCDAWNYHAVVDVDGNGIPELICTTNAGRSNIYTYSKSKGKKVRLASIQNGKGYAPYYNTKSHKVALLMNTTGDSNVQVYKISGTKATKTADYYAKRNYSNYTWSYKVNGKKVSEKKYYQKVESITQGKNWVQIGQ